MSTAARFHTDLPTMEVASRHVFSTNEQIQGILRDLLARLDPLMGTWQGQAAVSFHGLKDRWNENAQQLNLALHGIAEALVQTQANYQASEESNTSGFTGITAAAFDV